MIHRSTTFKFIGQLLDERTEIVDSVHISRGIPSECSILLAQLAFTIVLAYADPTRTGLQRVVC